MDSLKPWLRAVAIKLLSTFTERKADDQFRTGLKEASVCRDGETIRVRIDELTARSSNVVQIVEFQSFEPPYRALLSDTEVVLPATFNDAAVKSFESSNHKQHITRGTRGALIQIKSGDLVIMPRETDGDKVSMTVDDCQFVGCGGNGISGQPQDFGSHDELQATIRRLSLRLQEMDEELVADWQTGVEESESPSSQIAVDEGTITRSSGQDQALFTQLSLVTQVPLGKAASKQHPTQHSPRSNNTTKNDTPSSSSAKANTARSRPRVDANDSGVISRETQKRLTAKKTPTPPYHRPSETRRAGAEDMGPHTSERGPHHGKTSSSVTHSGVSRDSRRAIATMDQPEQSTRARDRHRTADMAGRARHDDRAVNRSSTQSCAVPASNDDPWKGMERIRKRDVKIPKAQEELLARKDCWIPPEPGHRDPTSNVPVPILRYLTDTVERPLRARRSPAETVEESIATQSSAAGSQDGSNENSTGSDQEASEEEEKNTLAWTLAPPRNAKDEELPPDSSPPRPASGHRKKAAEPRPVLNAELRPGIQEAAASQSRKRRQTQQSEESTQDMAQSSKVFRSQSAVKGDAPASALASLDDSSAHGRLPRAAVKREPASTVPGQTLSAPWPMLNNTPPSAQPEPPSYHRSQEPATQCRSTEQEIDDKTQSSYSRSIEAKIKLPIPYTSGPDSDDPIEASVPTALGDNPTQSDNDAEHLRSKRTCTDSITSPSKPVVQVKRSSPPSRPSTIGSHRQPRLTGGTQSVRTDNSNGGSQENTSRDPPTPIALPSIAAPSHSGRDQAEASQSSQRSAGNGVSSGTVARRSRLSTTMASPPSGQIHSRAQRTSVSSREVASSGPLPTPQPKVTEQQQQHDAGTGSRQGDRRRSRSGDDAEDEGSRPGKRFRLNTSFDFSQEQRVFRDPSELARQERAEYFRRMSATAESTPESQPIADPPAVTVQRAAPTPPSATRRPLSSGLTDGKAEDAAKALSRTFEGDSPNPLSSATGHGRSPGGTLSKIPPIPESSLRRSSAGHEGEESEKGPSGTTQPTPKTTLVRPAATPAAPSNIYDDFKRAYPSYTGTLAAFVSACALIEWLVEEDRMEHRVLWDEFVYRSAMDYKPWCQQNKIRNYHEAPYDVFFRERVNDIICKQRIIRPENLLSALRLDPASAGEMRYRVLASSRRTVVTPAQRRASSKREHEDSADESRKRRKLSSPAAAPSPTTGVEGTASRRSPSRPKVTTPLRPSRTSPVFAVDSASQTSQPPHKDISPQQHERIASHLSATSPSQRPPQAASSFTTTSLPADTPSRSFTTQPPVELHASQPTAGSSFGTNMATQGSFRSIDSTPRITSQHHEGTTPRTTSSIQAPPAQGEATPGTPSQHRGEARQANSSAKAAAAAASVPKGSSQQSNAPLTTAKGPQYPPGKVPLAAKFMDTRPSNTATRSLDLWRSRREAEQRGNNNSDNDNNDDDDRARSFEVFARAAVQIKALEGALGSIDEETGAIVPVTRRVDFLKWSL